jgi:hypothetical protein
LQPFIDKNLIGTYSYDYLLGAIVAIEQIQAAFIASFVLLLVLTILCLRYLKNNKKKKTEQTIQTEN